jgi:uncharacterized SAM-binding protein YcdF (DUF218 family)
VFYLLSKLLDVFLSPLMWGALLLAAAVPWRDRKHARSAGRTRRRRRICGAAGLLVLFVASSPPIANWFLWQLEHSARPTFRPDVTYDAVILLGGVVEEQATASSGQPSYNDNVERVVMTHKLLKDGNARVAIISGASSSPAFAAYGDSVVLAHQLEDWGIAKERIIGEDKAVNTRENALFTKKIARDRGLSRVLVVTSAFHMPRAAECFAAVDMDVDTLSVDYRADPPGYPGLGKFLPRAHSLGITASVVRELFGRLVYRVQGYGRRVPSAG